MSGHLIKSTGGAHASHGDATVFNALALLAAPALVFLPGSGTADVPKRIPLEYSYDTTDAGESFVSRIDIWASVNNGQPQRLVFDTGSDRPNMQIGPDVTGAAAEGEKQLYLYGDATYGYLVQQAGVSTLTFHDPGALGDASATVTLPMVGQSGYEVAQILDIVYTKDNLGASKLNLSSRPVFSRTTDGVTTDYYADLDARELIAAGKAADEGGTVWGTLGAGNYVRKDFAGTYAIGGTTTTGYIVAANGNSAEASKAATPGCSPCLIVDLDQSLRAQFGSFMPWGEKSPEVEAILNTLDAFPGSGAPASTEYEGNYTLALSTGASTDAVEIAGVRAMLDTGTPGGGTLTVSEGQLKALIDAGVKVTEDASGAYTITELAITAPDGNSVALAGVSVAVVPGTTSGAVFIAGQDFFLSQSVMYDLQNKTTAYTPYFVSADNFTTDAPGEGEVQLGRVTAEMGSAFPEQDAAGREYDVGYFGAAGVISGAGDLAIAEHAVLRLTNANTYTGETLIERGGTLELGGIGSIEASARVMANGLFDIGDKGNLIAAWGISDAYDNARIRSLAGAGRVQLGENRLILTAAADSFSGTITDLDEDKKHGGGGLSVAGGVQTLTGANTYIGATLVAADAGLILTGSLLSPVSVSGLFANHGTVSGATTVRSGGMASGTGSYAGLAVAAGGTVASGGAKSLKVAGDFTQAAGSRYVFGQVAEGAGIAVTGSARIAPGARLHLTRAAAGDFAIGESYLLLSTGEGVSGSYGSMTGDLATDAPFLAFTLDTEGTDLLLDVERSGVAFADVAASANQGQAAAGLESLGTGHVLYDRIVTSTAASARESFNLLSGEIHASLPAALMEDSHFLRDAVTGRLRAAISAPGASRAPVQTPEMAQMSFVPATTDRPAWWGQAFGAWGHLDGDGNAARIDRRTGGLVFGADAPVDRWRLGAMIGYSDGSYDLDDRNSSGSARSVHLGGYAGTEWGALAFRSGVALSWHRLETDRAVMGDRVSADYDGHSAQIFGELARRIDSGGVAFEPYAGLAHVRVKTDAFAESGGAAALTGAAATMNSTFSTLGLRAGTDLQLGSALAALSGGIGWRHAFGDISPAADMAFPGGAGFGVAGGPIARNAALLELGLDVALSDVSTLRLDYEGQIASGTQEHRLAASFNMEF